MLAAVLLSAGMISAVPAMPAANFIPGAEDFRRQKIQRVKGESEWPFTVNRGEIVCAPSWKNRLVYFIPQNADGDSEHPFALDYGMMTMALVNMGQKSVLRPYDNFEQLLRRLSPYIAMGKRLCDQPAGTDLPDSAL